MTNRFEGSRYQETKDLPLVEVAKLLRGEIKAAQKSGVLPRSAKFRVRCRFYSMGQSLDVSAELGFETREVTEEAIDENRFAQKDYPWLNDRARAVYAWLRELRQSFQYDDSRVEVDYFCYRFGGSVEVLRNLKLDDDGWQPKVVVPTPEPVAAVVDVEAPSNVILFPRVVSVEPAPTTAQEDFLGTLGLV